MTSREPSSQASVLMSPHRGVTYPLNREKFLNPFRAGPWNSPCPAPTCDNAMYVCIQQVLNNGHLNYGMSEMERAFGAAQPASILVEVEALRM